MSAARNARTNRAAAALRQEAAPSGVKKPSFWERHEPTGHDWITSDEKRGLAANGTRFSVQSVEEGVSAAYGPQWIVNVLLDNEERALSFTKIAGRDAFFADLKTEVAENGPMETKLIRFRTTSGQTAYGLGDPNAENVDPGEPIGYRPDGSEVYPGDADAGEFGEDEVPF